MKNCQIDGFAMHVNLAQREIFEELQVSPAHVVQRRRDELCANIAFGEFSFVECCLIGHRDNDKRVCG